MSRFGSICNALRQRGGLLALENLVVASEVSSRPQLVTIGSTSSSLHTHATYGARNIEKKCYAFENASFDILRKNSSVVARTTNGFPESVKRISSMVSCDTAWKVETPGLRSIVLNKGSCRRSFGSSTVFRESENSSSETAAINPLQQTPSMDKESPQEPAVARRTHAQAVLRGVPISPKKLNEFARLLRGLHIEDALIQCKVHPKKSAKICEKVLLSARANAVHNHGLAGLKLKVDEAWVGKGTHLKRISIHGRGRSSTMLKYRSHLTIVLKEEAVKRRTKVLPMLAERYVNKFKKKKGLHQPERENTLM